MNKKTTLALSLFLGTALTASAVFADVAAGNGYYSLKETVKRTTATLATEECDNYTIYTAFAISSGDKEFYSAEETMKCTNDAGLVTSTNKNSLQSKTTAVYETYRSKNKYINKHINELGDKNATVRNVDGEEANSFNVLADDPFEEEEMKDVEKVIDAGVGSLKDSLFVSESQNGKMYYGSIDNAQIPVFINTLSSFLMKYSFFDGYYVTEYGLPALKNDIAITNVSGKGFENSDGLLTELLGTVNVSGTDENGVLYNITISLSYSLCDVGTTTIEEPDLTGFEVEYLQNDRASGRNMYDKKYEGTYASNITAVRNDEFVKIGENRIVITEAEEGNIKGTIDVIYYDDTENKSKHYNFESFIPLENGEEAPYTLSRYETFIRYLDEKGEERYGIMTISQRFDNNSCCLTLCPDVTFVVDGWTTGGTDIFVEKVFD